MERIQVDRRVFHRANGGVRYRQGKTEILCALHGPRETSLHTASSSSSSSANTAAGASQRLSGNVFQLSNDGICQKIGNDHTALDCTVRPAHGMPGCNEKFLARTIRQWLGALVIAKLLPRAYAQLVFQIVHDDGSLLSACFNAGVMTLLDAGIPLRSMAAAVEFQTTSLSENYTHTFDSSPDAQQSALAEIRTRHTICYEPSAGENGLLGVHSEGPFTPQQLLEQLQRSREVTQKVIDRFRQLIAEDVRQPSQRIPIQMDIEEDMKMVS